MELTAPRSDLGAAPHGGAQPAAARTDIKGLLPDELREFIARLGKERYRASQLLRWVHGRGVHDFDEMTDLTKTFREELRRIARVEHLGEIARIRSADGETTRLVFRLADGLRIETVAMQDDDRRTVCVSSQAGCALQCDFCATGQLGLGRNLTAGELVDQVIQAAKLFPGHERPATNVVFMGMGEPLQNYDAVVRAVCLLSLEMGLAISAAHVTVSTAGLVPMIHRLAADLPRVGLAISLNATTDEVRTRLMPINRRYPLAELMAAAAATAKASGRRWVTFEYALIDGVNDSDEDARRLVRMTSSFPCKINLIPFNPVPDRSYRRPPVERIERFAAILADRRRTVTVRWSKGDDITAACGQLQALAAAEPSVGPAM